MSSLSVVIITRNEEKNLQRCLESVKWADEIIVVDSGSTDDTTLIAAEAGALILSVDWHGFGPSKQAGVEAATSDWILSLDADEQLSPGLVEEIKAVLSDASASDGYCIPRLTQFIGRWMRHGGWYPDPVLRLFRRGKGTFNDNLVHEEVVLEGTVGRLESDILHYCYPSLESYLLKLNRYTSLAAEELHDEGYQAGVPKLILNPMAKFVKQYILRAGFLDGTEGLTLALLSAGYVLTKYAKLRALNRQSGISEGTSE